MSTIDPWAIDNSSGAPSYSGSELRLTTVTPHFAGAGASLGVYSGVRPSGSGTDLLVQAQASPNMTVKVNPGVFVAQGSISSTQGAYTWVLDTVTNLTISAAHATLSRTDLIVVRIRDASVDTSGQRDGGVVVVTGTAGSGTPALPTDASYFTIAQITVPATVTNIGGGGGGTIADKRTFAAALGGAIPCTSTTRPTASGMALGQLIYETDTRLRSFSDGSTWRLVPGQTLYSKRDTSSTLLFNQAAGSFLAAFTTAAINVPNTSTGQAYDVEWTIPGHNGAFTNGLFNSWLSVATNGSGTYTGIAKSGPVVTNQVDTWQMHGFDTWKAGNSDTSVNFRVSIIAVGGNFDSICDANNPLLLKLRSTGLLATEV